MAAIASAALPLRLSAQPRKATPGPFQFAAPVSAASSIASRNKPSAVTMLPVQAQAHEQ